MINVCYINSGLHLWHSFAKMTNREQLATQRIYPTINNDDLLEFRIPPNSKGQLDLRNVMLHFITSVPTVADKANVIMPQNFFGAKQFSSVEIRVNGESATRKSCSNEFFLSSYFENICNYPSDYMTSAFRPSGIFDCYQTTTTFLGTLTAAQKTIMASQRLNITSKTEYEIFMGLNSSIFGSGDLLPSNTPIEISFERSGAEFSSLLFKVADMPDLTNTLKDVYLTVPFIRDEQMFHLERNSISKPLKINYDEYIIKRFNIPKGSTSVMLNNALTGSLPHKLFWGIQTSKSFTGSYFDSSTRFDRQTMAKASLYVNGKEMTDFPYKMSADHISVPYVKFLQNTDKQNNGFLSKILPIDEYNKGNFILSATFDPNESGSISFGFEFDEAVTTDLILVTCSAVERCLKLDHNRNFQII